MSVETEIKGSVDLSKISDFLLSALAGRTTAKVAGRFAEYLKNRRFEDLYENRTGETKESIGAYRYKSKTPAYIVKAGLGIPGNLNYLAGLYRGEAVSRSGKRFSYARKRDLINDGWASWGGGAKIESAYNEVLEGVIKEAEEKLER
jgi:hypothetical protein